MSEQVYLKYIKLRVKENLKTIYTSQADTLSKDFKHAAACMYATEYIIDTMTYNLQNWSYNQAKMTVGQPIPDIARSFLTTEFMRRYTITCVQQYSLAMQQNVQQNNISQTR